MSSAPTSANLHSEPINADILSRAGVALYRFIHGRLHVPGGGWALRRMARVLPGLQKFPYVVPGVGTAVLDFRDAAAYGMVNSLMGELENDAPLLRAFKVLLRPGAIYWDVGANVGYLAQQLMRAPFDLKHLHAFEPSPTALRTLQSLFGNHARATVHPVALGASNDTIQMNVDPAGSQLNSFVRKTAPGPTVAVPVRRADDLRAEQKLPPPDVVKIDVEGFEPQVLEGMRGTIAEASPVVIFEHIWLDEQQVRQIVPPGYELLFLLDNDTLTQDMSQRMHGANAIMVPSKATEVLAALRREFAS